MILAIDSTTKKAAAALLLNDGSIVAKNIDNEITHSEKLLPLVDELLKENSLLVKDLDRLACTLGPGSFTGVRIGIATVKALAKVLKVDIIGVTSLNLLAAEGIKHNTKHKYVLATMDAKNDRIYYELFEIVAKDNDYMLKPEKLQGNLPYEAVISLLKEKNVDDILVACDNKKMLSDAFLKAFNNISILECELKLENIFKHISSYPTYNYDNLDALYFRNSEAERTKNGEI